MVIPTINNSNNDLPSYETHGAAGMDLRAYLPNSSVVINSMERKLINTGIKMEIPKGYEGQIRPRSGLALKSGITVLNTPGTIDSDFRGEIQILLINLSQEPFTVNNGDRIAQIVFSKYESATLSLSNQLSDSKRGDQGYGHTGIN
ncbi:MAG: dUTP diphosphatase [Solitalea-like symbiont of Acarus siro]